MKQNGIFSNHDAFLRATVAFTFGFSGKRDPDTQNTCVKISEFY